MSQNPILKAGSASDVISRNKGRVEYGNILGQQMAVEAGILPSVTLQKGGGGSAASRVTSILGASVVTAAERTTAVTNLISNVSINAATAVRLSAAASGKYGITNVPGAVTTTIPGAPTGLVATPSSQTLSIAFSINTGNSPITNYSYSMDGVTYRAFSPAQTSSPVTITTLTDGTTALTNGTSYTVYLKATNAIGTGPASASVTAAPATAPGAPTIGTPTAGDGSVSLTFTAPGSNGGTAITNYSYSTDGTIYTAFSPAQTTSPLTISGLTNAVSYTVRIKAINAAGSSVASSASASFTPATAPGAPTIGTPTAGGGSVSLTFTAPGSNGGSAITNYSYSTDGTTYTALSPAQTTSPLTISGLTNGVTYTIRIKAINSAGSGTASSASASFTPAFPDLFSATGTYTTLLANGRKYYRFTGPGTVVVGAAAASVEYFAVGGGGGGGGGSGDLGGGGGAGGLQTNSSTYATGSQFVSISQLTAGATYTVTIGDGGNVGSGTNGNPYIVGAVGQNTTFTGTGISISATGGGGGKGSGGGGFQNAKAGGCGGGGGPQDGLSFLGIGSQGFNGFNVTPGGGGGIGASATSATGGVGLTYPTGGSTYGAGGTSGGGTTASANTGNGGGGANANGQGGYGGSGIFIISYPF